jgi:hypothetical protein
VAGLAYIEKGEVMQENVIEPRWRRARRCGTGACVEFAVLGGSYGLRDSKDPESPVLAFDRAGWKAFIVGVNADVFR